MSDETAPKTDDEALQRTQAVKHAHEAALMARANVVGVGIGLVRRGGVITGEVGIIVMVSRKQSPDALAPEDVIPEELEGVPVDVQEVGEVRAQ
jgi:hypothetical protein